jgi:hypothetical protein
MAKYRIMEFGKQVPPFVEDDFCAAGAVQNTEYSFAVGALRVVLSKEEKERTIDTWNKIDRGELAGG